MSTPTQLNLPSNPRFLLNFTLLTTLLFSAYYAPPFSLYDGLEKSYFESFWLTDPSDPLRNQYCDLRINAQIPQYLSSFVEREIVVSVENISTTEAASAIIIVKPEVSSSELKSVFIFQSAQASINDRYEGSSSLQFDNIPPRGVETKNLTVKVSPKLEEKTEVDFQFYLWKADCDEDLLTPNTRIRATVDADKTIIQSFLQVLLLPPLANGVLPLIALFFALLYEGVISEIEEKSHSQDLD